MKHIHWLVSVFIFILYTNAATINVDPTATGGAACGSTSDPCATIQEALDVANSDDTISLAAGVYTGTGNENITLSGETKSGVSLVGASIPSLVQIQCTGNNPALLLFGPNAMISTISDLTIAHCRTSKDSQTTDQSGGALYMRNVSSFQISNVVFDSNIAGSTGGAIFATNANGLTITGSNFTNNIAIVRGGAFGSAFGSATITRCNFIENAANGSSAVTINDISYLSGGRGGAAYTIGTSLSIIGSRFVDNTAVRSGGAVCTEDSQNVVVDGTYFINNTATGGSGSCPADASCDVRGGAFYGNDVDVNFKDCVFVENSASTPNINQVIEGGAVYIIVSSITKFSPITVNNCRFENNYCVGEYDNNAGGFGGALYVLYQPVIITSSMFTKNWVGSNGLFSEFSSAGGAIWLSTGSTYQSVINTTQIVNNYVVGGAGGGLFATDCAELYISDSIFNYNGAVSSYTLVAQGAGALIGHESVATMNNVSFNYNLAIPRFDIESTSPLTYSGQGAGLFVQSATTYIRDSIFTNNIAYTGQFDNGAGGGAFVFEDSYGSSINNCIFSLNGAQGYSGYSSYASSGAGGAGMLKFSQATINGSTFISNWVGAGGVQYSSGGAIAVFYDYITDANVELPPIIRGNRRLRGSGLAGGRRLATVGPTIRTQQVSSTNSRSRSSSVPFFIDKMRHDATSQFKPVGAADDAMGLPVIISNCTFFRNAAYGLLCSDSPIPRAGQGGGVSVMGADNPGVEILSSNFTQNIAKCDTTGAESSLGGGLAVSLYSYVNASFSGFYGNVAWNGVGDDVAATSLDPDLNTEVNLIDGEFTSPFNSSAVYEYFEHLSEDICNATKNINGGRRLSDLDFANYEDIMEDQYPKDHGVFQNTHLDGMRLDFFSLSGIEKILFNTDYLPFDAPTYTEEEVLEKVVNMVASRNRKLVEEVRKTGHVGVEGTQEFDDHSIWVTDNNRFDAMTAAKELQSTYRFHKDPVLVSVWNSLLQDEISHVETHKPDGVIDLSSFKLEKAPRRQLNPALYTVGDRGDIISPSILVNGVMTIENPVISSDYLIFTGDIFELFLEEQNNMFSEVATLNVVVTSELGDTDNGLTLTGFKANITLIDTFQSATFEVARLLLFNSTLSFTNNVTVSNSSIITGSTLTSYLPYSLSTKFDILAHTFNPTLKLYGTVMTGLDSDGITMDSGLLELIRRQLFTPFLGIDGCTLEIYDVFNLTALPPTEEYDEAHDIDMASVNVTEPLEISMSNTGSINITTNGVMHVTTTVYVSSDSAKPSIFNDGEIHAGVQQGSGEFAALVMDSNIDQSPGGRIVLLFDDAHQMNTTDLHNSTQAALVMSSNASLAGAIDIELGPGTHMEFYDPPATTFLVAQYRALGSNITEFGASSGTAFNTPAGLDFETSIDVANVSYGIIQANLHGQTLAIAGMSCSVLSTYYENIETNSQLCGYCLRNSSCDYCPGSAGSLGTCGGSCGGGIAYTASCCPHNCYGSSHGSCHQHGDISSIDMYYSCKCTWWYTETSNCGELGINAYLLIFGLVLFVVVGLIVFSYRVYYSKQEKKVLEDLRLGLLYNEEDSGADGGATGDKNAAKKTYIQSLQQDLILKDVFVNYEDIKFEGKIGEGSFGVVYKGMFRGAQVAVKQMRAPLFQAFTEQDIDEFRKEAYMMSRLRHPNIVLVMGIALLDQEPVQKKKILDDDEDMLPKEKDGKKEKLHKTVCIITEYLDQGSLADILYGPNKLAPEVWTYELVLTCALQAARGMLYLHSHKPPICHRDLKSSNLVVDDHWVVKVTDFGMSRIIPEKHRQNIEKGSGRLEVDLTEEPDYAGRDSIFSAFDSSHKDAALAKAASDSTSGAVPIVSAENDGRLSDDTADTSLGGVSLFPGKGNGTRDNNYNPEMTSNLGTTAWCAPELLATSSKTRYSVKIDVYSFGMVLWELWERKRPYDDLTSRFDIMDAIRSGQRPPISANCPPSYKSLIQRCWQAEPTRRPMFQYIVRYLKEELAKVRRQRSVSVVGNNSVTQPSMLLGFGSAFSPESYNDSAMRNGGFGRSQSLNYAGTMSDQASGSVPQEDNSITSSLQNILPNWSRSSGIFGGRATPTSTSANNSNKSGMQKNDNTNAGSDVEFTTASNPLVIPQTTSALSAQINNTASSADEGVSPTSAEMQWGMPSQSQSSDYTPPTLPSAGSTTQSSHRVGSMTSNGSAASQSGYRGPGGVPGGTQGGRGGGGGWRDKYVMKFSGWSAAQPDTGLPPSLASQGGQKNNAGPGYRYPQSNSIRPTESNISQTILRENTSIAKPLPSTPPTVGNRVGSANSLHNLDSDGGNVGNATTSTSPDNK